MSQKILDAFVGLAVGDALGVPVEFQSRQSLSQNPVTNMRAYGTHQQPAGTWSDDSSLAFCLAESLCNGYQIEDIAQKFQDWRYNAYWTAHEEVFDIGITTSKAIANLKRGVAPQEAGGKDERSNGNGALMRILPLIFYSQSFGIEERFRLTQETASLTHGHIRSILACFIYNEYALELIKGSTKQEAYQNMQKRVLAFCREQAIDIQELTNFDRLLREDIQSLNEEDIYSSGYVLHTLEASLWCLLRQDNYADTVLAAVNLGEDTDTTACVVGGLAGILYGTEGIPEDWQKCLARLADIEDLAKRFQTNLSQNL